MDIRTDILPPALTNKVLELVSKLVVHSSINFLVMFLAAAHSYLFLCLRLSTECLVSATEQVFNPDEWRGINALLYIIYTFRLI